MKIVIETIPHTEHRYSTFGDYWRDPDGTLQIRVSEMIDHRDSLLCAIHELVEVLLCEERGIAEPDIMAFDVAHPDAEEPGELPDAPYHKEHVFAEAIERLMALELGRNWQDYCAAVEALPWDEEHKS
jgi:hypothetical protein